MAEKVSTGGNMTFNYDKGHAPKLDERGRREIEEAYARAEERKRKERRNRIILGVVIALIVVAAALSYVFLR